MIGIVAITGEARTLARCAGALDETARRHLSTISSGNPSPAKFAVSTKSAIPIAGITGTHQAVRRYGKPCWVIAPSSAAG